MSKKDNITIQTRISTIAKDFEINEVLQSKFMVEIVSLIERVNSPELFCPKCDQKMNIDLEKGKLYCIYCGHKTLLKSSAIISPEIIQPPQSLVSKTLVDTCIKPNNKFLNKIDELARKRPKGAIVKRGKSIAELAGKSSSITEEDKEQIKASVPGLSKNSNINFV